MLIINKPPQQHLNICVYICLYICKQVSFAGLNYIKVNGG